MRRLFMLLIARTVARYYNPVIFAQQLIEEVESAILDARAESPPSMTRADARTVRVHLKVFRQYLHTERRGVPGAETSDAPSSKVRQRGRWW